MNDTVLFSNDVREEDRWKAINQALAWLDTVLGKDRRLVVKLSSWVRLYLGKSRGTCGLAVPNQERGYTVPDCRLDGFVDYLSLTPSGTARDAIDPVMKRSPKRRDGSLEFISDSDAKGGKPRR